MATVYVVQTDSYDGGEIGGVFSTDKGARAWIERQPEIRPNVWHVVPSEIDRPRERDDATVAANLEAKGHSFVFDPHHRCVHCEKLIGPLWELEEKAKLSDLNAPAPGCPGGKSL